MPNRKLQAQRIQAQPMVKPTRLENVITPWWVRVAVPLATYRKQASDEKKIYLTFDDGPTSKVTDQILELLKPYEAKATFFCLGQNVEAEPGRFQALIDHGHLIGNHSYSHPNGWKTDARSYVRDVMRGQEVLTEALGHAPKYFRPPFGRLSVRQMIRLGREFQIVMWDILSLDYRTELTGETVANNVIQNATSGSIVLLHDSDLAAERVLAAVPRILTHFTENGFRFCTLDQ